MQREQIYVGKACYASSEPQNSTLVYSTVDQPGQSATTQDKRPETFTSSLTGETPATAQKATSPSIPAYFAQECATTQGMLKTKERISDAFSRLYESEVFENFDEIGKNEYTLLAKNLHLLIESLYWAGVGSANVSSSVDGSAAANPTSGTASLKLSAAALENSLGMFLCVQEWWLAWSEREMHAGGISKSQSEGHLGYFMDLTTMLLGPVERHLSGEEEQA